MESNMTYEDAFNELKQIEEEIQNEEVSVDVLAEKIKRASQLITICQAKLTKTETEVNKIISQMEQKPSNTKTD